MSTTAVGLRTRIQLPWGYVRGSGASLAVGKVASVAAVLKSFRPGTVGMLIAQALTTTANKTTGAKSGNVDALRAIQNLPFHNGRPIFTMEKRISSLQFIDTSDGVGTVSGAVKVEWKPSGNLPPLRITGISVYWADAEGRRLGHLKALNTEQLACVMAASDGECDLISRAYQFGLPPPRMGAIGLRAFLMQTGEYPAVKGMGGGKNTKFSDRGVLDAWGVEALHYVVHDPETNLTDLNRAQGKYRVTLKFRGALDDHWISRYVACPVYGNNKIAAGASCFSINARGTKAFPKNTFGSSVRSFYNKTGNRLLGMTDKNKRKLSPGELKDVRVILKGPGVLTIKNMDIAVGGVQVGRFIISGAGSVMCSG